MGEAQRGLKPIQGEMGEAQRGSPLPPTGRFKTQREAEGEAKHPLNPPLTSLR